MDRARELALYERYDEAEAELVRLLDESPDRLDAHLLLARVRHVQGDRDFARALRAASERAPKLRVAYADTLRRAGQLAEAERILRALGSRPDIDSALSVVLLESGRHAEAIPFARSCAEALPNSANAAENLVAALLSAGEAREALTIIERFRAKEPHDQRWLTYRADVARHIGEAHFAEWCDHDRFVRVYDLAPPLHDELRPFLESRHERQGGHPLDQTLRGGTEASMGLVGDREPVTSFFEAIAAPIAAYQAELGHDASHPFRARNIAPASVVGAWSVRLRAGGFHGNHTHPLGWLSAVYYVAVPSEVDNGGRAGWLKFGEPLHAMPAARAEHFIQPRAGRLVLFPSYMWHGTVPIEGAETRLTIAFDAVPTA